MKKIAGALLLVTSLFAFAPAARAAVSNDELLTKLEKIEQRVAHDIYYIENWSTWLDLKILFMTPLSLITTKNAY